MQCKSSRVVMLGAPGSGKGTQGAILASALGVPHVASSDLLRQHAEREQGDGADPRARMARGELVDDEAVIDLVLKRLGQPDARPGFVLDGFPRNTTQAAALDRWLTETGTPLAVALLEVPRQKLLDRLAARAAKEQRHDDDPQTRLHRLDVYESEAQPLVAHYRRQGALRRVDADDDVDTVAERVRSAVCDEPSA
jgi:adenylate kinase